MTSNLLRKDLKYPSSFMSHCSLKKIEVKPLSADPVKWSNTLKQFVSNSRRIVWVCLTILWG